MLLPTMSSNPQGTPSSELQTYGVASLVGGGFGWVLAEGTVFCKKMYCTVASLVGEGLWLGARRRHTLL